MTISILKLNESIEKYSALNINYIKLNPLSILSVSKYNEFLKNINEQNFEIIHLNKDHGFNIIQVPRLAWKKIKKDTHELDTITYGAGALWKLSVHPLKGNLTPFPSEAYVVPEHTLLLTRTGKIDVSGIIFDGFYDIVRKFFNKEHVIFTEHLLRVINEEEKNILLYLVVLFNSFIGKLISNIAWYGALQPELDRKIIENIPIPLAPSQTRYKLSNIMCEAYKTELKAWQSYFKAMEVVEDLLGKINVNDVTDVGNIKVLKQKGRLDGSALLAFNLMDKLITSLGVPSIPLNDIFDIIPGNVPWTKEYIGTTGITYIGTDAIDESGIIDFERLDKIPPQLFKKHFKKTKWGDLLIVKDGIGSLGKVGIPQPEMYVRSGILILSPKANSQVSSYYVASILKSKVYRKIIEMLAYGTTGQLHLQTDLIKTLKIPLLPDHDDIANLMESFVKNMYRSCELKSQAIAVLEEEIDKALT